MRTLHLTLVILLGLVTWSVVPTQAQNSWTVEGGLRRWRGEEIKGQQLGCSSIGGNPVTSETNRLQEVDLATGNVSSRAVPDDGMWTYIPRNPNMLVWAARDSAKPDQTTLRFYNATEGGMVGSVEVDVNTTTLAVDVTDTWVADDASIGAVVFAPTPATPSDSAAYLVIVFDKDGVKWTKNIKPKVDVDIYVRPEPEEGVLVYVRGNGLQITGYAEEVFTNASYIYFNPNGQLKQLSLPERGPGSGKGRRILWHSNKWDRLVFTDEYASGLFIIKASNGIPIDTVEHLSIAATAPLRIISASGNSTDRWMITHAKTADKNALVLWAMPDLKEVTTHLFETSDPALKQLPLSPWSVIFPFLSVSQSGNALYAWDPQDILDVAEDVQHERVVASPLPASQTVRIAVPSTDALLRYAVYSSIGLKMLGGEGLANNGELTINVGELPAGLYTVTVQSLQDTGHPNTSNTPPLACRIVVAR